MSLSGVTTTDDCLARFEQLKKAKSSRFIIFTIKDSKVIDVAAEGPRESKYEDFLALVKKDEPCYAVFDFETETDDGLRGKLVFISWIPDIAKVRPKMLYASSKDALKTKIEGGLVEVQATDASEIAFEAVLAKVLAALR